MHDENNDSRDSHIDYRPCEVEISEEFMDIEEEFMHKIFNYTPEKYELTGESLLEQSLTMRTRIKGSDHPG